MWASATVWGYLSEQGLSSLRTHQYRLGFICKTWGVSWVRLSLSPWSLLQRVQWIATLQARAEALCRGLSSAHAHLGRPESHHDGGPIFPAV